MVLAEHCPELTETDPVRLAGLYEDVTPRMRAVLDLLEWDLWPDRDQARALAAAARAFRASSAP